ncbi:MAG: hypothetical protein HS126_39955 [Anaerolineales bacterium]|nr:hypothetical protein [Anaerolineales bacterium]
MIKYCPVEQIYAIPLKSEEEATEQETLQQMCRLALGYLEENGATSRKALIQHGKELGYLPFTVDQARRALGDLIGDTKASEDGK